MATIKKITKRDHFNALHTYFEGIDLAEINDIPVDKVLEFIEHELDLLDRKTSSGVKKPTAQQVANEGLRDVILEAMEPDRMYTITEMQKEIPACADLTNQRISSLLRPMLNVTIRRVEDKRKAYFVKM